MHRASSPYKPVFGFTFSNTYQFFLTTGENHDMYKMLTVPRVLPMKLGTDDLMLMQGDQAAVFN